jgi:type IV pilus biogenesis protein CpaD/CtpE
MKPHRPTLFTVALSVLAALVFAGCADLVVDDEKAQDAIAADIDDKSGITVRSVECPKDVSVVPGDRFSCEVRATGGKLYRANLLILDEDANLRFESLEKVK